MISFGFYPTHYKVYIHLPCINTQRRTTGPFDITHIISSSNHQTEILYWWSDDCCEGDHNSNIIRLLQPSQTISYCNQSVLSILLNLNIFLWIITIFISFWEVPWYSSFLLCARYLYNSMGLRFYIFGWIPDPRFNDHHCHGWVHCIVTTKIWF